VVVWNKFQDECILVRLSRGIITCDPSYRGKISRLFSEKLAFNLVGDLGFFFDGNQVDQINPVILQNIPIKEDIFFHAIRRV
jgi:hypothetical protein